MKTYKAELSRATIHDVESNGDNAEFTRRCLPAHQAGLSEMREDGTIDGVPVRIYYMLDEDDCAKDDMSRVDWEGAVDRIELDPCACERHDIAETAIDAVVARFQ
jgi:hypothetical protein